MELAAALLAIPKTEGQNWKWRLSHYPEGPMAFLPFRLTGIFAFAFAFCSSVHAADWSAIRLVELFNGTGQSYILRNGTDFGLPTNHPVFNLLTLKPQCAGVTHLVDTACYQSIANPHVVKGDNGDWFISAYGVWKPPFPEVCDAIGVVTRHASDGAFHTDCSRPQLPPG